MHKTKLNGSLSSQPVTPEDVMKLFDDINTETLLAILELHPRVADLEEAALRRAGDGEAVGRRQAIGMVAQILDLIETPEEQELPTAGPKRI
jgi:hypothetical protein